MLLPPAADRTPPIRACVNYHHNIPYVTQRDILKELRALDPSNAGGPSEIGPGGFRMVAGALAFPLYCLWNKMLATKTTPGNWRMLWLYIEKEAKRTPTTTDQSPYWRRKGIQ
eukprot:Filipodium_phascolosomae@DN3329_c0_g1_i1.p1